MNDIYVDDLVIGATFWGIGYAVGSKGLTLIIEKSNRLGQEFIDCYKFGDNWDCPCLTQEGEEFKEELKSRNILSGTHKPILQACCPMLSMTAANHNVKLLLATRLLTMEKTADEYLVEACNASGIIKIHAKRVLDTADAGRKFDRKSINAMLNACNRKAEEKKDKEFELYPAERPDVAYLKFFVPEQDSLMSARSKLYERLYSNYWELKGFTVISVAKVFDYHYSTDHQASFGISGSFTNPVKAFDAGVHAGKAGERK